MKIAVRERGVDLSAAGREYAAEQMRQSLADVVGYVRQVSVYVTDQNGPKGGTDKSCRVAVALWVGRSIHVEARGTSVSQTVDGAADKVGHRVHEAIHRNHDRRRTARLVRALKRLKSLLGRKGEMP